MSLQPIIDKNAFEELKEAIGDDFIDEILQAYFDETPKLIKTLQKTLDDKDYEAFTRSAHSIKSTSNSIGALQYGAVARELEMAGRERNLENISAKVEKLISGYAEVKKALEELTHAQ